VRIEEQNKRRKRDKRRKILKKKKKAILSTLGEKKNKIIRSKELTPNKRHEEKSK